jgi:hypothetical protein
LGREAGSRRALSGDTHASAASASADSVSMVGVTAEGRNKWDIFGVGHRFSGTLEFRWCDDEEIGANSTLPGEVADRFLLKVDSPRNFGGKIDLEDVIDCSGFDDVRIRGMPAADACDRGEKKGRGDIINIKT